MGFMKKVIVTGGAGFIGSNLVDELISKGISVIVIDDESSNSNDQFYWNKKAEKLLGWTPKVKLENWLKLNKNTYRN
tara:strand:+ start:17178 stop:17408 length:231 start_codon:yes stop_codon:yes gene_type:complete